MTINTATAKIKTAKTTTAMATALILSTSVMATSQVHAKNIKTIDETTASYAFTVKNKVNGKGSATRTLQKNGNSWTYTVNANAKSILGTAKASQSSTFKILGNKVKPSSAYTSFKILGIGNTHKVKFNGSSAVSTYKNKSKTLSMPSQAFDDLSLEVQIRQDLLNNKFTGNYKMVKKDKIANTKFKKSGKATITVPAGTYNTVRVDRIHSDKGRQTSFWLAPELDYLPVKVYTKDGKDIMKLELKNVK